MLVLPTLPGHPEGEHLWDAIPVPMPSLSQRLVPSGQIQPGVALAAPYPAQGPALGCVSSVVGPCSPAGWQNPPGSALVPQQLAQVWKDVVQPPSPALCVSPAPLELSPRLSQAPSQAWAALSQPWMPVHTGAAAPQH